jgi:hypothetical protein
MKMMKYEFERLVNLPIDDTCYERIEYVYTNCEAIKDKRHIARIYEKYDMNGIEKIYRTITGLGSIEDIESTVRYLKSTL